MDSNLPNRQSIRLPNYDYSSEGLYFITICTQGRECLLGKIINGEMQLNAAGKMIEFWLQQITDKFSDIACDTFVIMPNHLHFIIQNHGHPFREGEHEGSPQLVWVDQRVCPQEDEAKESTQLSTVIQWFKTMTTNFYIRGVKRDAWQPFDRRLWQRNYYEHIIRNQSSYQKIVDYILLNPSNWSEDQYHL